MQKIFLTSISICLFLAFTTAQVKPLATTTINKKDVTVVNGKTIVTTEKEQALNTWVDIYELPNYQGRVVRFTKSTSRLNLPFTPDRISIKRGTAFFNAVLIETGKSTLEGIKIDTEIPNVRINNTGLSVIDITPIPYYEIFENPNYLGKSKLFAFDYKAVQNGDDIINPTLPFTSNAISIKISDPSLLLYIYDNESAKAKIVSGNSNNITIVGEIKRFRYGKKAGVKVCFNGFLTTIHNNDCKRLRGYVRFSVNEIEKDNITFQTDPLLTSRDVFKMTDPNFVPSNLYNIEQYWVAERDGITEPYRNSAYASNRYSIETDRHENKQQDCVQFEIDEGALLNNRVILSLFTKLTGNHKGCDMCTDFTTEAGMLQEQKSTAILNIKNPTSRAMRSGFSNSKYIQFGSFRSSGGQGSFTGPEHPTYLQFSWEKIY